MGSLNAGRWQTNCEPLGSLTRSCPCHHFIWTGPWLSTRCQLLSWPSQAKISIWKIWINYVSVRERVIITGCNLLAGNAAVQTHDLTFAPAITSWYTSPLQANCVTPTSLRCTVCQNSWNIYDSMEQATDNNLALWTCACWDNDLGLARYFACIPQAHQANLFRS